jgi:murein L,D-transpeptidase YcbB/YkuD
LRAAPATRIRGIQLLQPRAVVAFYEARGFQPAWTLPAGAVTIVQTIRRSQEDGLTPADYHLAALDGAIAARGSAGNPELDADLQVLLADATAALVDHVLYGKVLPATLDKRWNVDPRIGAPPLESVLNQLATAPALGDAINALQPRHFIYTGLKKELARLRSVASAGSWPAVPPGRASIKPGARDPRVIAVRKRLAASGELASNASPESDVYDAELEAAVKRFQDHHRLNPDGAIGKTTLDALNVPLDTRIGQVRVNMERARWVTNGLRESFLLVNLPAFKVYYIRDGKNIWESKTQIGRAARRTPAFRADLRYLVFNPDWTVPPTILEQDVLAGMRKGQNTIAKKRLTILDRQGNAVDPASIDWATARPGTFPYTLRQPPGADNALGRVKFIFPNQYSIFLHDTPSRDLFSSDQRTFSSGCIRVEKPLDLAAALLERDGWNRERVQSAVDAGQTETVLLREPLPVLIVYWTVSVGASGELRFAQDVYKLDAIVLRALDTSPASGATPPVSRPPTGI